MYETLKLIHVLAVIVWFGGSIWLVLLIGMAARASDTALGGVAELGGRTGALFGASSGIAFLTGIAMVLTTDGLEFEQLWITIGVVAFLIGTVLGARVLGPRYHQLGAAVDGGQRDVIDAARKATIAPAMVNLTVLTVATAAMVFRWTL